MGTKTERGRTSSGTVGVSAMVASVAFVASVAAVAFVAFVAFVASVAAVVDICPASSGMWTKTERGRTSSGTVGISAMIASVDSDASVASVVSVVSVAAVVDICPASSGMWTKIERGRTSSGTVGIAAMIASVASVDSVAAVVDTCFAEETGWVGASKGDTAIPLVHKAPILFVEWVQFLRRLTVQTGPSTPLLSSHRPGDSSCIDVPLQATAGRPDSGPSEATESTAEPWKWSAPATTGP